MVLRESLVLAGVGVGLGIAAALASGRLIERLLFELAPTDGSTFAQAIAVMGAVAAFAAYLPARRAARVDPMVALRCE
jgi:putative ABC transport system permease protein